MDLNKAVETINEMDFVKDKGYLFVIQVGRKYSKIIRTHGGLDYNRSAWCFVDEDGNIYKPASWSAPAKNFVRGTVEDLLNRDFVLNNLYGF